MSPTYRIRDWDKLFESHKTRILKELRYVLMPNKQDGDGYTELVDHPNGAAHFGAWCAIVQVGSKCNPRGTLIRQIEGGSRPHDARSLARLTRLPATVFDEAIPRLLEIGWLEQADAPEREETQPAQTGPSDETATRQGDVTVRHVSAGQKPEGVLHPAQERRAYENVLERIEPSGTEEKKDPTTARLSRAGRKGKTLCPEDFSPSSDTLLFAKQFAPKVDIRFALPEFIDYWRGEGEMKADWDSTFRNRLRFLQKREEQKNGNGHESYQPNLIQQASPGSVYKFKSKAVIR